MNYSITKLSIDDAKAIAPSYKFALVYEISKVRLGLTSDIGDINWDEVTEARFFSDDSELHFVFEDEEYAVKISDADSEGILLKEYYLAGRFKSVGKSIIVKQYLCPDEDGQMNIAVTRLAGINQGVVKCHM